MVSYSSTILSKLISLLITRCTNDLKFFKTTKGAVNTVNCSFSIALSEVRFHIVNGQVGISLLRSQKVTAYDGFHKLAGWSWCPQILDRLRKL